jgi:hypothetical protein
MKPHRATTVNKGNDATVLGAAEAIFELWAAIRANKWGVLLATEHTAPLKIHLCCLMAMWRVTANGKA